MKIEIVFSADDLRIIEEAVRKVHSFLPVRAVAPKLTFGSLYVDENGNVRTTREIPEANAH